MQSVEAWAVGCPALITRMNKPHLQILSTCCPPFTSQLNLDFTSLVSDYIRLNASFAKLNMDREGNIALLPGRTANMSRVSLKAGDMPRLWGIPYCHSSVGAVFT